MLSSPWGTFLPVVLGTLHQSEMACAPSLRFVIPLQRPCQALSSFRDATAPPPGKIFCLAPPSPSSLFQSGSCRAPCLVCSSRGGLLPPCFRRTLHRMRLRGAPHGINPQHHPAAHLPALQPVPFPDIRVGHTD